MDFEYSYGEVGSIGQYRELKVTTCYRGEEYGVSSLLFDPQEDLLWAATYGVSHTLLPPSYQWPQGTQN